MSSFVEDRVLIAVRTASMDSEYGVDKAIFDKRVKRLNRVLGKRKHMLLDVIDGADYLNNKHEIQCYVQGFKDAISILCEH